MRLLAWPLWIRCLVSGLVFGVGMWAVTPDLSRTVLTLAVSLAGGLVFGILMLVTVGSQERRVYQGEPPLTGQERVAVAQAVAAGTPPEDDRLRAAGERLARMLAGRRLSTRGQAAVFGFFQVLALVLAVTETPWFWLGVLFWIVVMRFEIPAERRRRAAAERYLRAAATQV